MDHKYPSNYASHTALFIITAIWLVIMPLFVAVKCQEYNDAASLLEIVSSVSTRCRLEFSLLMFTGNFYTYNTCDCVVLLLITLITTEFIFSLPLLTITGTL